MFQKKNLLQDLLFSSFNQETSKYSMTCQNNSVQNQGHKQHVIVNMLFQKVVYGNIVNKVIYGNIVNMMLKIVEHPIYITLPLFKEKKDLCNK